MKAHLTISVILFLFAVFAVPSSSAASSTLTVKTDASSYAGSQALIASGAVSPAPGPGTAVFLKITFPSGGNAAVAGAAVNGSTGAYQQRFVLGGTASWVAGTYTLFASWGNSASNTVNATTTFMYTPATTTTSTTTTTTTSSTTTTTTSTTPTTTTSTSTTTSSTTTSSSTTTTTTISTPSTSPTTTTSTPTSTTTTPTTVSTTTSASSGGGGIPEFPYQLLATSLFALLLVASYLVIRGRMAGATIGRPSVRALHEDVRQNG